MLLSVFMLTLLLVNLAGVAALLMLHDSHHRRTEAQFGAVLATLTTEDPRPIDPTQGRVLNAGDLTDDDLMAEVRRRNGGHSGPEAEEQP